MTYSNLKEQADELKRQAEELQRQADAKMAEANAIKNKCKHEWAKVKYDPIITKGYEVPGDPPGTMGVDRRCVFYVVGTNTPKWTRTCLRCGFVQTTKTTKMVPGSDGLKHEVPNFEYADQYA